MRVIVIGAGVSGLTAARDLVHAGADVTVIEARDRIGGRTWTAEVAGAQVDVGGSWIHGPFRNPLVDEVKKAGLTWSNDGVWGMGLTVYGEAVGARAGNPNLTEYGEGDDGIAGWASADVAATLVAVLSDFDAAEAAAALGPESNYSDAAAWYLRDRRLTGAQADAARFGIEWLEAGLNIAGLPDRVSVPGCAAYELHAGGNVMITGGYVRLVEHLAAGLDIHTSEPVTTIEHAEDGCTITTSDSVHRADHAIVTVPLGVLQRRLISFDPSLPAHEAAADRLAMGNLEKVVFRFDHRFWPDSSRRMTFMSADRRFPTWIDTSHHAGHPTLIAFYNPFATPAVHDMQPDERAAAALDVLRLMIPEAPDPIAVHVTDWTNDPHSHGSYSYVPVGGSRDDMEQLGRPGSGRLHFAGEHTTPAYFGTVHGAYLAGRRAAAEVLEAVTVGDR